MKFLQVILCMLYAQNTIASYKCTCPGGYPKTDKCTADHVACKNCLDGFELSNDTCVESRCAPFKTVSAGYKLKPEDDSDYCYVGQLLAKTKTCKMECNSGYGQKSSTVNYICNAKGEDAVIQDASNVCVLCHEDCATCKGAAKDNSKCLRCKIGKLNADLDSASTCDKTNNNVCNKLPGCVACNKNVDKCSKCDDTKFLSDDLKCKSGCSSGCATCEKTNWKTCKTCAENKFLQLSTKKCMDKCDVTSHCRNNFSCEPLDSTKCTKCNVHSLYKYLRVSDKQCVAECHRDCKTCDAADNEQCLSCASDKFLDTKNNTCVATCASASKCLTCKNVDHTDCLTCAKGKIKKPDANKNTCVEPTPCSGNTELVADDCKCATNSTTNECVAGKYCYDNTCKDSKPTKLTLCSGNAELVAACKCGTSSTTNECVAGKYCYDNTCKDDPKPPPTKKSSVHRNTALFAIASGVIFFTYASLTA